VIDSPFVLAGIVVFIVGILFAIIATIAKSRIERGFTIPSPVPAYTPVESEEQESADLSRLDALLGGPVPADAEDVDGGVVSDPVAYEPAAAEPTNPEPAIAEPAYVEPVPDDVVDIPDRDFEPLPGLWHHLIETDDGPLGVQDRLDMVARLEMVGEKWCVDALHSASTEEQDLQVNAAVRAALARLGG
jgi:hypothetical protein